MEPEKAKVKSTSQETKKETPTIEVVVRSNGDLQLNTSSSAAEYSQYVYKKFLSAIKSKKVAVNKWSSYSIRGESDKQNQTIAKFITSSKEAVGNSVELKSVQICFVVKDNTIQKVLLRKLVGTDDKEIKVPVKDPSKKKVVQAKKKETVQAKKKDDPKIDTTKTPELKDVSFKSTKPLVDYDSIKTSEEDEKAGAADYRTKNQTRAASSPTLQQTKRDENGVPSWAKNNATNAKTAADAAGSLTQKLHSAAPKEETAKGWQWMTHSPQIEAQLKKQLFKMSENIRNTILEKRKKKSHYGNTTVQETQIDGLIKVAQTNFKDHATPLCYLIEDFVRPDYLTQYRAAIEKAVNPKTKKPFTPSEVEQKYSNAGKSVLLAYTILQELMSDRDGKPPVGVPAPLAKFALELLEKTGFQRDESTGVAEAKVKSVDDIIQKLSDPKAGASDQARLILDELSSSASREFNGMKKESNESKKVDGMRKLLKLAEVAGKSNGSRNCDADTRRAIKAITTDVTTRVMSYAQKTGVNVGARSSD